MLLYISEYFISPPDCCKQAYVLPLFLVYFFIFKRFLPDQLSQNLPDQFSPNCKVGIMVTVDDQFKISLSVPQGTLPWQPNFIGSIQIIELSHTIEVQGHSPDGSGIRDRSPSRGLGDVYKRQSLQSITSVLRLRTSLC